MSSKIKMSIEIKGKWHLTFRRDQGYIKTWFCLWVSKGPNISGNCPWLRFISAFALNFILCILLSCSFFTDYLGIYIYVLLRVVLQLIWIDGFEGTLQFHKLISIFLLPSLPPFLPSLLPSLFIFLPLCLLLFFPSTRINTQNQIRKVSHKTRGRKAKPRETQVNTRFQTLHYWCGEGVELLKALDCDVFLVTFAFTDF